MAITRRRFLSGGLKGLALLVAGAVGKTIYDQTRNEEERMTPLYMIPEGERDWYLKVYGMPKAEWETHRAEYQLLLDDFEKNKEKYIKEAKNYPWMNPKNLTERDKVYIVSGHLFDGLVF